MINPGETWVLLPAIYGNGDKCWSLIGTFSANNQHPSLYNGYTRIGGRAVSHNSYFSGTQINQTHIIHSNLIGNNSGTVRFCFLPEILPFSHDGWLENHQVRHGKEMTFTPIGSANMILRLAAGQQWWIGGSIETGDRTISPGIVEKFIGILLDGVQTWFLLSRTKTDGSPVGFSELESSVTEQGGRITALEGAGPGVTTFSGLTDTPNGYHPGKMLSYNLAGDAIVPVDPVNSFKGLTDTPNDYSGQSSKAIVVKGDESGLEFASMPNLAPLQSEINNLHNDLIGVNNNIYVQGQKITTAEGKIGVLEGFT
ncbi:MAG: hypothetical protein ACRDCE_19930, partial [Cetobacterium sp.]|uniref:hypothetical protein n=1 Tax=Cetobacterium sp. TaxID=2071632 RepID=UPI003EE53FA3